jgi:hypothetical protein
MKRRKRRKGMTEEGTHFKHGGVAALSEDRNEVEIIGGHKVPRVQVKSAPRCSRFFRCQLAAPSSTGHDVMLFLLDGGFVPCV